MSKRLKYKIIDLSNGEDITSHFGFFCYKRDLDDGYIHVSKGEYIKSTYENPYIFVVERVVNSTGYFSDDIEIELYVSRVSENYNRDNLIIKNGS